MPVVAHAATAEEAKAFSERAAAYILEVGEERAFADFTRPDGGFVQGELYVFCYDHEGVNRAHGGNPLFVGKDLLHIKDPDGKEPNDEIVTTGFEQGQRLGRLQVAQSDDQADSAASRPTSSVPTTWCVVSATTNSGSGVTSFGRPGSCSPHASIRNLPLWAKSLIAPAVVLIAMFVMAGTAFVNIADQKADVANLDSIAFEGLRQAYDRH